MKLYKYQSDAVQYALEKRCCALFLEMGLGKTVISLSWLQTMKDIGEIRNALVIGPLHVVRSVWPNEIRKWNFPMSYSVVTGRLEGRKRAMRENTFLKIINAENVVWLVDSGYKFDAIIFDESTLFKSQRTQRFRRVKRILKYSKARMILTGTPSTNSLADLWSQYFLVDQGETFGTGYIAFMQRYFVQNPHGFGWDIKDHAAKHILKRAKNRALSMRSADWIGLPPKIPVWRYVEFSADGARIYEDIEKHFITELDSGVIKATGPGSVIMKLAQASSGFLYDEDTQAHDFDNEKIKELKRIVEDNPGENLLVSCTFVHSRSRVMKNFPDAVFGTTENIEAWNRGEVRMMIVHPKSHSKGLNLQSAGSMIVWYDLTWSMEDYVQLNARLWRQGQTKSVRVIHLVRKNSLDGTIIGAIKEKISTNKEMINYISKAYRGDRHVRKN